MLLNKVTIVIAGFLWISFINQNNYFSKWWQVVRWHGFLSFPWQAEPLPLVAGWLPHHSTPHSHFPPLTLPSSHTQSWEFHLSAGWKTQRQSLCYLQSSKGSPYCLSTSRKEISFASHHRYGLNICLHTLHSKTSHSWTRSSCIQNHPGRREVIESLWGLAQEICTLLVSLPWRTAQTHKSHLNHY